MPIWYYRNSDSTSLLLKEFDSPSIRGFRDTILDQNLLAIDPAVKLISRVAFRDLQCCKMVQHGL